MAWKMTITMEYTRGWLVNDGLDSVSRLTLYTTEPQDVAFSFAICVYYCKPVPCK